MGGRWELHRSTVWTIFAPNNTEITNTDYQRVTDLLYKRIIGGTRAEYARHFLGKMKKMSFSLEKKEKNIIFASEGLFTFDIGL